ncbi:sensor histidine kinase [Inquilinus sp.]|uniref:sensor histidine kinase n=1 Tax=Inquilinus sp. TaxID=1932117 RepID=UPI0031D1A949
MSSADRIRGSLYVRILAFIAVVVCLGTAGVIAAAAHYARLAAGEAYDRLLVGGAVQVAENVFMQGGVVALDPPVAAFASLSAYDLVYYKVVDPRGVVVAGYPDLALDPATALQARHGVVVEDGSFQGEAVRVAVLGRRMDDSDGGWATVVLAQTTRARDALARSLTRQAVLIVLAMGVLTMVAGAIAVRWALAPLIRIEKALADRAPDDLKPLDVATPTEIRTLVSSINLFMGRLAGRIGLMQRFIADAAHQIRTPLAALDAQVELLGHEPSAERREQQMERVRQRTAELGRLTNQLLNHAMVIHRGEIGAFVPVDLVELARTVLAAAVPLSFDRDVRIAFEAPEEPVVVDGDAVSLREALSNIIHNALAHGAETRLSVRVGGGPEGAWIEVNDDGPGIAEADRARALEPFHSGSDSGTGLGLAIAAEVMKAHRGRVDFRQDQEDGFSVLLRFGR